jgi:membrane-associated phospholipid phosphatase
MLSRWPLLKRPAAACDCNLTNTGGRVGGTAGFPSGHMTSTTFLLTPFWLKHQLPTNWFIAIIVAVAWARWYKKCHNLPQIIGGIAYGGGAAYLLRPLF